MVPIAAPVRKDTLEKESRAKVKIRLYLKKKQNNCSSQIIALLSNKLAEEFFFSIQLPIANLLCSQILMNATMMFVILMLTVPTLMVHIIASVRKDTSEMDSLANVY